jgi:catechol 2,3-dioxygenase-like lactoylglutathione lyase family enzyme
MNVIRIDHVSLNAADRPATLDWYANVLGLHASRSDVPPDQPVFVGPKGAQFGLFADKAPGLRHVALATDHASQAAIVECLEQVGIRYALVDHRASHSVYFSGPDGTTLEVLVPR